MSYTLLVTVVTLGTALATKTRPYIIAHRGSPCELPEETLEGYKAAIEKKVDYIEMDVVSTSDKVLVTRHDLVLNDSTNIEHVAEFKGRSSTKKVEGGVEMTGFFTIDFTWAEIQVLRARQRLPFRDHKYDDLFKVPRLSEILALVKKERMHSGSDVGVYVETKFPDFHKRHKISLEELLIAELKKADLLHDPGAVYLQSFSFGSLKKLHDLLKAENAEIPMTWLVGCAQPLPSDKELAEFAKFGTALGPNKQLLVEIDSTAIECNRTSGAMCNAVSPGQMCIGRLKSATGTVVIKDIVHLARKHKLELHPYTFRNEGMFMALDFESDLAQELKFYTQDDVGINVDGVFVDCPTTAVNVFASKEKCGSKRSSPKHAALLIVLCVFGGVIGTIGLMYVCCLLRPQTNRSQRPFGKALELRPWSERYKPIESL